MRWPWQKEERAEEETETTSQIDDILLRALLGGSSITKKEALNIPSVKSCIQFIADTVSMLPIKLYKDNDGKAEEEEKMVTDLLIFGGWLGLLTIIAVIDEIIKKRKKVRK